jgi:hypothetical protein
VATPVQSLDDLRVLDTEVVWRLIHPKYYQENPSVPGEWVIASGAFSFNHKNCSVLRSSLVLLDDVKAAFPKYGIAALRASDVRLKALCCFALENDPAWPNDAHACIYKAPNKKPLKPINWNALTLLAQQNLILEPIV